MYENAYIDTSACIATRYPAELVAYMKKNGRKKVMFGTNHPMLTADMCLRDLDAPDVDDGVREFFLYQNAVRVFGVESCV